MAWAKKGARAKNKKEKKKKKERKKREKEKRTQPMPLRFFEVSGRQVSRVSWGFRQKERLRILGHRISKKKRGPHPNSKKSKGDRVLCQRRVAAI
jgi:hypothetical protein